MFQAFLLAFLLLHSPFLQWLVRSQRSTPSFAFLRGLRQHLAGPASHSVKGY